MTKDRFLQTVQIFENWTHKQRDLEFFMLLKGNSYQNVTFLKGSTKS